MTIFLTILKIIGIILLVLLGSVLLLLMIVLFVPIRYSSTGKYDEENKPLIEARVTWLCHIVRFCFTLKGKEKDYWLKVLWIKILPKKEKEESSKKSPSEDTDKAFEKLDSAVSESNAQAPGSDENEGTSSESDTVLENGVSESTVQEDTSQEIEISESDVRENAVLESTVQEDTGFENHKDAPQKKSFFSRLNDRINNFRFKFNEICDRIKTGRLKAEDIVDKITDPRTSNAITLLLMELKRLLYHMRPRKFRLYIKYGFDDPSYTGQLYGFYNSLYGIHKGKPDIVPDFENKCFEGDYMIKGHLQLVFVLVAFIKLYFNKDVKRLWAIIKNR